MPVALGPESFPFFLAEGKRCVCVHGVGGGEPWLAVRTDLFPGPPQRGSRSANELHLFRLSGIKCAFRPAAAQGTGAGMRRVSPSFYFCLPPPPPFFLLFSIRKKNNKISHGSYKVSPPMPKLQKAPHPGPPTPRRRCAGVYFFVTCDPGGGLLSALGLGSGPETRLRRPPLPATPHFRAVPVRS